MKRFYYFALVILLILLPLVLIAEDLEIIIYDEGTTQPPTGSLEVYVMMTNTPDYWVMTTFENGGNNTYIHPENDFLVPGSIMRFSSLWMTHRGDLQPGVHAN